MVIVLFDKFTMQETSHKMHLRIMSPKEILSFVTIALLQTDFWAQSLRGLCEIKFYQMELASSEWCTSTCNKCRVAKAQTCFNIYSFLRICKYEKMIY